MTAKISLLLRLFISLRSSSCDNFTHIRRQLEQAPNNDKALTRVAWLGERFSSNPQGLQGSTESRPTRDRLLTWVAWFDFTPPAFARRPRPVHPLRSS